MPTLGLIPHTATYILSIKQIQIVIVALRGVHTVSNLLVAHRFVADSWSLVDNPGSDCLGFPLICWSVNRIL